MTSIDRRPRILIVTRGDYITRTVLLELFRARDRFDLSVVIVKCDDQGRTGAEQLRALLRSGARRYCAYEVAQNSVFAAAAKVQRHSGLTVRSLARRFGVPVRVTQDVHAPEVLEFARAFAPDLLLSVKCPQLIGAQLRSVARRGSINVHASLLPRYAGRAPHFWALAGAETVTGSTVHYMNGRFDAGDVLVQSPVCIGARDSAFSLLCRLAQAGGDAVVMAVDLALRGDAGIPQDPARRHYCSHPTVDACRTFKRSGRRLMRKREVFAALRRSRQEMVSLERSE